MLLASAGLLAPAAWAAPRGLSGRWSGYYVYGFDKAAFADPDRRVPFSADLRDRAGDFVGRTDEPNTFADPAFKRLEAKIAGVRKARALSFVKTYATGEVRHSVDYRGEANRAWTLVEGVWAIGGGDGGLWRLARREAAIS
jgi:hypothetical protein